MIYAVVPAAGIGSRFGGDTPKQYCLLQGRTVLEHALERLLQVESIAKVMGGAVTTRSSLCEFGCRTTVAYSHLCRWSRAHGLGVGGLGSTWGS